jgi:hypothetical protein
MKKLIAKVLESDVVSQEPPVCVDIGASGKLPAEWRLLAPHATGVAFDADDREFRVDDTGASGWKRLVKLNRLVADKSADSVDFFLTRSPYCSSSLQPDNSALAPWAFSDLFEVEKKTSLPAVALTQALTQLGIRRIDWYKSDSQGMDLRIFASLPHGIINEVVVADFEPGIIDAYVGEDKLFALLQFMNTRPFFLSDMKVWGSHRIGPSARRALGPTYARFLSTVLKTSPGWAEISYLNDFSSSTLSRRACYLGWVFASIKDQDGHAFSIAERGLAMFADPIFEECKRASLRRIRNRSPRLALHVLKRGIAKAVGR